MHMQVHIAVIPAAGLGTRVLPASKAVPKEMLPLADTPTIQYVVEEAVASGIERIVIVTHESKRSIQDHFSETPELRAALERKGDAKALDQLRRIETMADIRYCYQEERRGLGHAVLMARELVGDEPFGVLLGDDLVVNAGGKPCLRQLIDVAEERDGCVLAGMRMPGEQISRYGVFDFASEGDSRARVRRVRDLVEKPAPEEAPSDVAVIGRYVLTPEIFAALERTAPGAGGEIQLTDGIRALLARQPVWSCEFEGVRYDTGDPIGYLTTSLDFALARDDLAPGIREYLTSHGWVRARDSRLD
jgi:UTP--glucose-1-phosphate uridylyltransferase